MPKLFSFAVVLMGFAFGIVMPVTEARTSSSSWKCRIQGSIPIDDQLSILLRFVHFDGQPNVHCVQENGTYWAERLNIAIRRLDISLSPAGIYIPMDADRTCDITSDEFELADLLQLNNFFERFGPDFVSRTGEHFQMSVVKGSCEPTAEAFLNKILKTQGTSILTEPIPAAKDN